MEKKTFNIGPWLQEGFNLYKQNFVLLIVTSLLAVLLGKLTMGILMGPMAAGVMLCVLRLIDKSEPTPEIGDVFKGFEFFLDTFLLVLACAVAHLAAMLLALLIFNPFIAVPVIAVITILVHTIFIFALCLIIDKRMDFWPAVMAVVRALRGLCVPLGLTVLIALLLSSIGGLACGIGILVTLPLYWCVTAVAYRDLLRNTEA